MTMMTTKLTTMTDGDVDKTIFKTTMKVVTTIRAISKMTMIMIKTMTMMTETMTKLKTIFKTSMKMMTTKGTWRKR